MELGDISRKEKNPSTWASGIYNIKAYGGQM